MKIYTKKAVGFFMMKVQATKKQIKMMTDKLPSTKIEVLYTNVKEKEIVFSVWTEREAYRVLKHIVA